MKKNIYISLLKIHEFIVMAKYNQMIDSMVEEFVRSEITKIV